ncbi:MAG: hypothetical protein LUO80_13155, partial [Methylococcaceae bacterium]|nr:hypothetical protein [Methylococcaceae bacterium]
MNEDLLIRTAMRHGITPLFCGQSLLPFFNKQWADSGIPRTALHTLCERWDIAAARRNNPWAKP